jgi:hypothetical protein
MPLDPTHVRLKLLHACDQWHSSRVSTPLTGWHCKLRTNTAGNGKVTYCATPIDGGNGTIAACAATAAAADIAIVFVGTLSSEGRDRVSLSLDDGLKGYGARFSTELYTRGCHWFLRLLASLGVHYSYQFTL